jgi:hypothetical protein
MLEKELKSIGGFKKELEDIINSNKTLEERNLLTSIYYRLGDIEAILNKK